MRCDGIMAGITELIPPRPDHFNPSFRRPDQAIPLPGKPRVRLWSSFCPLFRPSPSLGFSESWRFGPREERCETGIAPVPQRGWFTDRDRWGLDVEPTA